MQSFNINTSAIVGFTNKLEKMRKSALPSAIRGTLNNVVYDVKTNTMPKAAKATFVERKSTFFKKFSKYEKASGFNIKTMEAVIGFVESQLEGANNHAVEDLEQQEYGGTIKKKSFIALKNARKGNNFKGTVRNGFRLSSINNVIDSSKISAKNPKQAFRIAIFKAGKGGFVLGNRSKGILWRVNSLNRNRNGSYKISALYSFKRGRNINVKPTKFMQKASLKSSENMDKIYIAEATRQIEKLL